MVQLPLTFQLLALFPDGCNLGWHWNDLLGRHSLGGDQTPWPTGRAWTRLSEQDPSGPSSASLFPAKAAACGWFPGPPGLPVPAAAAPTCGASGCAGAPARRLQPSPG